MEIDLSPYIVPAIVVIVLAALVVTWKIWLRIFGVVIVPDDGVGVVSKKFALFGANRTLPDGAIVALNGESGLQADTLPPGIHYFYWPWQYSVDIEPFTLIPNGQVGAVVSRDGAPLSGGRVLGKKVECNAFQDARAFLKGGGQRGPQIAIIPPGTYRINPQLFSVKSMSIVEIKDTEIGIVTTNDGTDLKTGDIAGREVPGHNSFQDAEAFITTGGGRGLQEQVLLAGRYFINPLFASVEMQPLTTVPIAHVGVVIAYIGSVGTDLSGASFKHGNLVGRGERGVWQTALEPGKYPINPYTHKVELVPTANVVLNWATGKTESHKLDANLSTIVVRSSDGFKFNLDVSQIIHIPHTDASKVIARFGSMANLVTQVLEPTIGNYFRNAAQSSDVIDFLKNRKTRQNDAKVQITEALTEYNVQAVDTLIGDIVPPDDLMKTLTDRKLASEQKTTFTTQMEAQKTRQDLEKETALANTQKDVVAAERQIIVAEHTANAAVKTADGSARAKRLNADADAHVTTVNGNAEAQRTLAVGQAEAEVIKQKTEALEAGNYASIEIAKALSNSKVPIVPDIISGGDSSGGGLMNILLAQMITRADNGTAAAPAKK